MAPGVLGKTHTVMLGMMLIWGVVVFRLSDDIYLDIGMVACAGVATFVGSRWCRQSREFAEANPALALMEGADITNYQKFQAEAKGLQLHRGQTSVPSPTLHGREPIAPIGEDRDA